MLTDLDGLRPLVRDEDVALVGYRVFADNDHVLQEHVRDTAITVVDCPEVRERGAAGTLGKAFAAVTRPGTEGFWVHLDVDVLDDDLMPAVDYRHPGGLTWEEATDIFRGLLHASGARGLEVTIFNPRLDAGGSLAQHLSDLIASVVPWPRRRALYEQLLRDEEAFVIVARRRSTAVGYLLAHVHLGPDDTGPTGDRIGEVESLAVLPPERGHGLGTLQLDCAEAVLDRLEARDVMIGVLAGNDDALRFYERRGMTPVIVKLLRIGPDRTGEA